MNEKQLIFPVILVVTILLSMCLSSGDKVGYQSPTAVPTPQMTAILGTATTVIPTATVTVTPTLNQTPEPEKIEYEIIHSEELPGTDYTHFLIRYKDYNETVRILSVSFSAAQLQDPNEEWKHVLSSFVKEKRTPPTGAIDPSKFLGNYTVQ